MRLVGESVIGSTIMPLSDRFTRSTSDACSSTDRFLWMTPSPPCCAIAIARRDSVTVSMAALTSGTDSLIFRVSRVVTSTCVGTTRECRGTSRTSSNVSAVARSVPAEMSEDASVFSISQDSRLPTLDYRLSTTDPRLCSRSVTFLVFLAAPAGTRIVAADLGLVAPDGLRDGVVAADPGRLLLLGARRAERARRRRMRARADQHRLRRRVVQDQRGPARRGTARRRGGLFVQDRPQPPEIPDDLLVDAVLHRLEEPEALFLVLDERIALAISAEADAFLQMVEAVEVVLPL